MLRDLSLIDTTNGVPPVPTEQERLRAYRRMVGPRDGYALERVRFRMEQQRMAEDYAREQSPIDPISDYSHRRGL